MLVRAYLLLLRKISKEKNAVLTEDGKRCFKLCMQIYVRRKSGRGAKDEGDYQTTDQSHPIFSDISQFTLFARSSDSEMLSWPNSPLLVMLQLVDPNVLSGREYEVLQEGESSENPLRHLADLADPSDYSTHQNQLILAK
jgi:hypothetical protein